MPLESVTHYFL